MASRWLWMGRPRRLVLMGVLVALSSLSAACAVPTEGPSPVHISVCGSSSMAGLIEQVAAAYRSEKPHVTFYISALNSQEGLRAVLGGEADIGLVARPLSATEIRSADTEEPRVAVSSIGQDAVAVIVSAVNPVVDSSLTQLRSIYTGETWTWSDAGGDEGEIAVVTREEGSGTRDVFESWVLDGARLTPRAIIMSSTEAVAHYVREHPQAIGYLSSSCNVEGTSVLTVDGMLPGTPRTGNDPYPMVRPLYFVTAVTPSTEVREFVSFVLGRRGQAVLEEAGYR